MEVRESFEKAVFSTPEIIYCPWSSFLYLPKESAFKDLNNYKGI